jgi:hypothetical protein
VGPAKKEKKKKKKKKRVDVQGEEESVVRWFVANKLNKKEKELGFRNAETW